MRVALWLILLGLPLVDLLVTVRFAAWTGIPVWFWLAAGAIGGWLLLRNERTTFRARSQAVLSGRESMLGSLLDSGRRVVAGLLLILPGILTDCVALLLLALSINPAGRLQAQGYGRGQVLDGEYRRVD